MARRRKDDKISALRADAVLAALPDEDLGHLAGLADIAEFPVGTELVREDGYGAEVFLLLTGQARVVRKGEELALLGPGEFVGEMALLDQQPRSATVVTAAPVRALVFDPRAFDEMVTSSRAFTRRLLTQVSTRLRTAEAAVDG